jgi:hypothetical protein
MEGDMGYDTEDYMDEDVGRINYYDPDQHVTDYDSDMGIFDEESQLPWGGESPDAHYDKCACKEQLQRRQAYFEVSLSGIPVCLSSLPNQH